MLALTLVLVVGGSALAVGSPDVFHQKPGSQKPVRENTVYVEWFGPPGSLNEMVLQADAVVAGRVSGSRPQDRQTRIATMVRTAVRLNVSDVFRYVPAHPIDSDELWVNTEGGERDRGDHIERTVAAGFSPLQAGQEYVLFLRHMGDGWELAYGPDSVFQITHEGVVTEGRSDVARGVKGMAPASFKARLWNLGVGKQGLRGRSPSHLFIVDARARFARASAKSGRRRSAASKWRTASSNSLICISSTP